MHVPRFYGAPSSGDLSLALMLHDRKIPVPERPRFNCVELMPFSISRMRIRVKREKCDCCHPGATALCVSLPQSKLCAAAAEGEKQRTQKPIKALHEMGIEVVLDVVFNHTAEGNENSRRFRFVA